MTLVALLALTTQAWATTVTWNSSDFNRDGAFTKDDVTVTTSNDARYYGNFYAYGVNTFTTTLGNFTKIEIVFRPESSPLNISGWTYEVIETVHPVPQEPEIVEYTSKLTWTGDAESVSIEAGVMSIQSITFTFADAAATTVPLTWDAATPNTASIEAMPAGNVTVSVEYFPQAEFAKSTDATPVALAPTAIANVPATTDGPIVNPGTVKNIGTSEVKQGTVMYYVSTTEMTDDDLQALTPDKWSADVPTAESLAEGQAYVYYYIKGAEPATIAERTDANTCSDGDILAANVVNVTLGAAPLWNAEFDLTNAPEEDKAPGVWSTDIPKDGVVKGTPVTVTYSGSKKIIGVKAEKKVPLIVNPVVGHHTARRRDRRGHDCLRGQRDRCRRLYPRPGSCADR